MPGLAGEAGGDHAVGAQVSLCRSHLGAGGRIIGAFTSRKLVGVGVLRPEIRRHTAQLAYLHVSKGCRRMGVGKRLPKEIVCEAKRSGADLMVVSATPLASAVGFYPTRVSGWRRFPSDGWLISSRRTSQ